MKTSQAEPTPGGPAPPHPAPNDLESQLAPTADGEPHGPVYLRDAKSRSQFLAKVGVAFIVYFSLQFLVILLLLFDMESARQTYRMYALNVLFVFILAIVLVLKLTMGLMGEKLRGLAMVFFLLDALLSMFMTLGCYFYFDSFLQTQYIWSGHYVLIVWTNMLASSIGFTLSTMCSQPLGYNFVFGILFMLLANFATCALFYRHLDVVPMTYTRYVNLMIFFLVYDIYFAMNANLVVTKRLTKFYDNEYFYCFFTFWTDWFSNFWTDFTKKDQSEVDQIKQKRKEKLEEKKRQLKEEEEKKNELRLEEDKKKDLQQKEPLKVKDEK